MVSKLALGLVLAIALCASTDAIAQTPQNPAPTFADVLVHSRAFNTWSATFKQQYSIRAFDNIKAAEGSIGYQRPDGIEMFVAGAMRSTPCASSPKAVFLCGSQWASRFSVQSFAGSAMNFPSGTVFVLTPITPTPLVVKILIYVDTKTLEVRREMVIDSHENRDRYDFENVVTTYWH